MAALQPELVYPLPKRYLRTEDKFHRVRRSLKWQLAFKRCFDFLGSALLLILLSPLFLVLAIWIPLNSKGPVFFSDERIGLHGRIFRLLKFRTMAHGAHVQRAHLIQAKGTRKMLFKHKRDPRITPLGRFLRKFSLDELPQLVNVLKGDMSLIGPRPYPKEDFDTSDEETPLYWRWSRERHALWPGLTGLWQVSGRNDLSFEQSMELDLQYVLHWSLRQDLRILWKTLPAVLAGRGAY